MQREAENSLIEWYQDGNRKPLVIRGARQVGKSTLVRMFCQKQGVRIHEINCEKIRFSTLEKKGIHLQELINEIELLLGAEINPGDLIFFDEIQESPLLLQYLRYFYEDRPQFAIIAAGSLLEMVLNDHDFSMPVGRIEYLFLGPFTFFEFLFALDEKPLLKACRELNLSQLNIVSVRDKLSHLLKTFYFVGGMPAAVAEYCESKSLQRVQKIQMNLLQTYQDDFPKYSRKKQTLRLEKVFRQLPQFLGKKVKYSSILRNETTRETKETIELLSQALLFSRCYHTTATQIPLSATLDESVYKIYFLDVGLFCRQSGISFHDLNEELIFEGSIAEQFVAQHLAYSASGKRKPELFYWLRDKKKEAAEIDFIIQQGSSIIPVEVKAGKRGKMKSLIQYFSEKHGFSKVAIKMAMAEKLDLTVSQIKVKNYAQVQVTMPILELPLYLVEMIPQALEDL